MDYTHFKQHVYRLTRIDLNAYKENQMKRRIDAFIKKHGCTQYEEFIRLISSNKELLEIFLSYITINVSEFYRNPTQWQVLEQDIVPQFIDLRRTIRIWSAACSTGDEPYSLAMLLSKYMPLNRIEILATDLDKEVLEKAKQGEYIERHLTNLPKAFKEKFFEESEGTYKIINDIKKSITFKQHNLLRDPYPKDIDMIVCRNVLIYFTEESKSQIYKQFSKSLTPGGVLFVGSTEQILSPINYQFNPHKFFFYKKISDPKKIIL